MERGKYLALAAVEDRMWYFHALHGRVLAALRRSLAGKEAAILEVGCGTGGLERRLAAARPEWRWTGVDAEPLACSLLRQRTRARTRARVVAAAGEALPFSAGSFDAVVLSDVLPNIEDDATALRAAARVLRTNGVLVVNAAAYPWLWSYHDASTRTFRRYRRGEIAAKLAAAGFDAIATTHRMALLLPLLVLRRKVFPPAAPDRHDVRDYPAVVDAVCRAVMAIEDAWTTLGNRWPWGSSIFAVARKID
jgi:SAM-dependent methyltransferase